MNTVYLSLGSNLGDRQAMIEQAMKLIGSEVGQIVRASDFIETQPWGFDSENAFLNMAAKVETGFSPIDVLHATQDIELRLGRTEKSSGGHYHDRPIDIDLLMYFESDGSETIINTRELTLPHPLMRKRQFVMEPLAQIAPELID